MYVAKAVFLLEGTDQETKSRSKSRSTERELSSYNSFSTSCTGAGHEIFYANVYFSSEEFISYTASTKKRRRGKKP